LISGIILKLIVDVVGCPASNDVWLKRTLGWDYPVSTSI